MGDLPQPNYGGTEFSNQLEEVVGSFSDIATSSKGILERYIGGPTLVSTIAFIISILLLLWWAYLIYGIYAARKTLEGLHSSPKIDDKVDMKGKMGGYWVEVGKHLGGTSPADWKLAVIEADSILDRLLVDLGFEGETLGERLKSVKREEMATLNDAWEAHKVRNRIAHEVSYNLTQLDAKKTISQFERVFREFDYI